MKTVKMGKKDQELALVCLRDLVEFVDWQDKEGNIDGSADPTFVRDEAKRLYSKYIGEKEEAMIRPA